jgi:hypothetical protein
MSGNYRGGNRGGGGKKDFKADPIKGYLSARSMAVAYAKDLCVSGKITLAQLPDYADRMTILQYGQISVDPQVDKEILRIAARVKKRAEQADKKLYGLPDGKDDRSILCLDCMWGSEVGTGECGTHTQDAYECDDYEKFEEGEPGSADLEELAAAERQREYEEQQRQAAEDDVSNAGKKEEDLKDKPSTVDGATTYTCGTCSKVYKTMKGLQRHEKAVHDLPEGK